MKKQIWIYRYTYIFSRVGFWVPALYFYLVQDKGMAPELALFSFGLISLFTALLEVPTGVVADKISRKLSIQLGILSKIVAFTGIVLAPSIFWIFVAMFIRALGNSLVSGADESLLYDSLKSKSIEKQFKDETRRLKAYHMVQVIFTTFFGTVLIPFGLELPIIATAITIFTAFIVSFFLYDTDTSTFGEEVYERSYLGHFKDSMKIVFSKKALASGLTAITFGTAIILGVAVSNKDIYSATLELFSDNYSLIGYIISGIFVAKAIGYFMPNNWVARIFKSHTEVPFFFLLYGIFMFLIVFSPNVYVTGVLIAIAVGIEGLYRPSVNQIFNDMIPSTFRSTLLSTQSFFKEITNLVYVTVFGILLAEYTLAIALLWIIIIVVIGLSLVAIFLGKETKQGSQ